MRSERRITKLRSSIIFLSSSMGLALLAGISWSLNYAGLPAQELSDVAPDATPQIQQVRPHEAAPGDDVTVLIEGRNFSAGAYVSFSDPMVHLLSTRRASATQLEAKLAISKKARLGKVTLYVSNPASTVAESSFTIAASSSSPSPPTPVPPPAPATTPSDVHPPEPGAPVVAKVNPPSAGRGGAATLQITGKNFAPGARVAFSNPGIRVMEMSLTKATELKASIQIAPDAATGVTSLFVVNPDDREVESSFEVTDASPANGPSPTNGAATTAAKQPAKTKASAGGASAAGERFDVYTLGNAISILQDPGKSKGTLVITKTDLKYEEDGNEVFSTPLKDVREIEENLVFGVKTGTFHVILKTGKSYNFIAASLRPPDTQAVVDSLRSALK